MQDPVEDTEVKLTDGNTKVVCYCLTPANLPVIPAQDFGMCQYIRTRGPTPTSTPHYEIEIRLKAMVCTLYVKR